MYKKYIILSAVTLLTLNGCTGTEAVPDNATQTGALTGALAGAVIGYNTKGHNKGTRAAVGAATGALVGGAIGYAVDEQNPPVQEDGGWE